jgi:hypothetical protein
MFAMEFVGNDMRLFLNWVTIDAKKEKHVKGVKSNNFFWKQKDSKGNYLCFILKYLNLSIYSSQNIILLFNLIRVGV